MASRVVLSQAQIRNFLNSPNGPVQRDLERRAENVLREAKRLAPKATGDLANSLRIVRTTQRGRPILRITSDEFYALHVVRGTAAPYGGRPGYREGSKLYEWAVQSGFPTDKRALFNLSRKLARRGTVGQSGNIPGNFRQDGGPQDWVNQAMQEARR